jgi:hypothetical protein
MWPIELPHLATNVTKCSNDSLQVHMQYTRLTCRVRSFFRGSQDLLASAGKDQQLIVWRLSPGTAGSLIGQQVLAVRLASGTAETQPRLAWHPTCANILFFTAGSHVLLCHIGEAAAVASQVPSISLSPWSQIMHACI